jgi:hypothetical protein
MVQPEQLGHALLGDVKAAIEKIGARFRARPQETGRHSSSWQRKSPSRVYQYSFSALPRYFQNVWK